jgi:polyphenol oxidase
VQSWRALATAWAPARTWFPERPGEGCGRTTAVKDSFRLGADSVYRCDAFQEFIWQQHGFGTKHGSPEASITLRQIHSDRVVNAASLKHHRLEADGLVTDAVGESVGVRTADCVPILLIDSQQRAVGALHAGWRGTASEIARRALEKMADDFETLAADVYAAIGPCIRVCCYEVGAEVANALAPFTGGSVAVKQARQKVDLASANRLQLEAAGVKPDRIYDCCLCTHCLSEQFFSYRREPHNSGRMLSSIARLA